jgi:2-iminobutanoate/2-iminopropanoate deaminase
MTVAQSKEGDGMSTRRTVNASNVWRPSPAYSHAVVAGGLVFVSGTMAHHPQTGAIVGDTEAQQLAQALENVTAILAAAGSSLDKAVSATLILADDVDFAAINQEWLKWFPSDPPARQGARFPVKLPGVKVSVALIASI